METSPILVYTDGACAGNPGPGGWAWAVVGGPHGFGSENPSTNQRMEVQAVLDALQTFLPRADAPIVIVSDSTYVVNCFKDRWWEGWERRGWKNSQKQPVANQDLWKPLVQLVRAHSERVTFRWVKGHSGNPMNDTVDALAVEACRERSPRTVVGLIDSALTDTALTVTALPDTALPDTAPLAARSPNSEPVAPVAASGGLTSPGGHDPDAMTLF